MSKNRHSRYLTAACALSLVAGYAQAGVSLDRTRIIITEKESSSSANLSNTSPDIPFLAQSWVEDEKGNKIASPLIVLPPLQRINGGRKGSRGSLKRLASKNCRRTERACSTSTSGKFRQNRKNPTRFSWQCNHASSCFIALKR